MYAWHKKNTFIFNRGFHWQKLISIKKYEKKEQQYDYDDYAPSSN